MTTVDIEKSYIENDYENRASNRDIRQQFNKELLILCWFVRGRRPVTVLESQMHLEALQRKFDGVRHWFVCVSVLVSVCLSVCARGCIRVCAGG